MLMVPAVVIAVLIAGVLGFAATRPDDFRMVRKTRIKAPSDKIFSWLDDFHRWPEWSPWEKLDPALKRTHTGAPKGKGAAYAWEGNNKVGKGRMEITDLTPPRSLTIKLDFLKPFEAHNITEFTLEPSGDSTEVTWSMHGRNAFPSKVMGVFVDMDKLIGKDFEKGLASLKALTESSPG
jgi:carbon monoxide dehydrogenase subunit G